MRRKMFFGAAALVLAGCVQADTGEEELVGRRDASVDSGGKDSGAPKDTGTGGDATTDSGTKDTSVTTDSGVDPDTGFDPDTGSDPDTGFDPDTGSVFDTGGGGGGACLYCSSGSCKLPLEDYSCLLNCLLDGWGDCTYTSGAASPCLCHD